MTAKPGEPYGMKIYGRVYKLVCNDTGDCYIGSTRNSLQDRLQYHINDILVGHETCMSREIIKRNNFRIDLLEEGWYESKEALLWRERRWMENTKCINKVRPIITLEERNESNNRSGRKLRGQQVSVLCYCGGQYKPYKRSDHAKRHIRWIHNFHNAQSCILCI